MLERMHLGLHVEKRLEGEAGLVDHSPPAVREAVLWQVTNRQRVRPDDLSLVWLIEAGEHTQQRGLPGAIGPAQPDAVAIANLPRDVVQQHAVSELFQELLQLNHCFDKFPVVSCQFKVASRTPLNWQ